MRYPAALRDWLFLVVWDIAWTLGLPIVWGYLYLRGRKEPLYAQKLSERFGGGVPVPEGAIWIHAVSLGELRAAQILISRLLDHGQTVLITNMTAAGRAEAAKLFANPISQGQLHVRWSPIDISWLVRRFIRRHRPKLGVILEIELWPNLITQPHRLGVSMVMAQAQYPDKSFARDSRGWQLRARLVRGFDLILAKSDRHADRFRHFGAQNVQAVGELRFEQPIPKAHLDAAAAFKAKIGSRQVFCLASTALEEDALLLPVLTRLCTGNPFIVYVPRHPKDFAASGQNLESAGLNMLVRSKDLNADLNFTSEIPSEIDGLLGDSLGEINFYYALADRVFVGDSFIDEGSHNVIEPLRLGKPVAVGPSIWGIEYPGQEAIAAGVLTKLETPEDLLAHWRADGVTTAQDIASFTAAHGGASDRIMKALTALMH